MMLSYKRIHKNLNVTNYKPSIFEQGKSNMNFFNEVDNIISDNDQTSTNRDINYDEILKIQEELNKKITEIDLLERQAYENGYNAGEKAGYEMGIQKAEALITQFKALIKELTFIKDDYLKNNNKTVIALAIAIAKKILEKEIEEKPEVLMNILNNAIKKLERQDKIILTINPFLQKLLETFKNDYRELYSNIVIDIDPNVSKNFVKIESYKEEVVIDFEEELFAIAKKLEELV